MIFHIRIRTIKVVLYIVSPRKRRRKQCTIYRVQQNYIHCISSFFLNSHDITFYKSSHRGVSATNSRRFHAWLYLHCQSSFHHKSDFIRLCLLSSEMLTIHNIVNILTSEHWLDFFSVDKNRPKTVSIHCIQIEQI